MPLSADDVVQENTGTTTATTSHVVTLLSGTTAGTTVVVALNTPTTSATPPAGMVLAKAQGAAMEVFYKTEVAAGETSWTFTTAGTIVDAWYVAELSNVDVVLPVDATAGASTVGVVSGGTASTGTTALNAGLYTAALAAYATQPATGQPASWSGYTNGFEEVADVTSAGAALAVARLFESSTTRTFECTATLTTAAANLNTDAAMVVFRAADSPVVAPLAHFMGMEWGTNGGTSVTGSTGPFGGPLTPSGTWNTNYLIQAGSARNSSYGLRIVQSGAAAFVRCGSVTAKVGVAGFNCRVVSATGTVVVAEISDNAATIPFAQLLYDSSATKFGVRTKSTGTTSWESGTTALNTWRWVDLRVRAGVTTWTADWRIETGTDTYTDQAPASISGQSAASNIHCLNLGANTAQTMTADFDDVVLSTYYAAFPLGPHEVKVLTVDPAGTPTVSGTTTNFSVFTANGTLAAWNATNARNALDEVPPTVSASADGVVQTAAAAADYMQFPMADYTLAADEFVNGVRMLAPTWSGTGAGAGDLAIRGYDGTTETALATVSQLTPGSPTAITSTAPVWRAAMWQSTNGWTQAELNACALRVGFSADATPDMGVSAIYLEVAIGKTRTVQAIADVTSVELDPTRQGIMSATTTAPADLGMTMRWTDPTGSGSQPVTAGGSYTQQFDPASAADVSRIEIESDPELPDRE